MKRYTTHSDGYIRLYTDDKKVKLEHRVIFEKENDIVLTAKDIIHHKDENKANNKEDNLIKSNRKEHINIHRKTKTMIKLVCCYCNNIFEREVRNVRTKIKNGQIDFYCNRNCMASHFGNGRIK